MYYQVPGGTTQRIGFDDEYFDVHLPPIGYVVDRMPDPNTGKTSEKLIKSEILFNDLPVVDQKWSKIKLPKNWDKWIEEEEAGKIANPDYTHPEADYFRAQEWRRRINGLWIAIGNNEGKETEYVYLTGFAYLYLNWWDQGFETQFRFVLLRIFYALEWAEYNPKCYGVILSTLRRLGKTGIAYAWLYDYVSRRKFSYAGSQAQKLDVAQEFFQKHLAGPFTRLPEFFRPIYDTDKKLKEGINFTNTIQKGKNAKNNFISKTCLNSDITVKETKSGAYDKAKLHRYIAEEPGKWKDTDIKVTFEKIVPAMKDGPRIIGKAFLPTTIEELEEGGDAFIKLFEDSLPSLMAKHNGKTISGLIALFIPAYEGFIFDQYGRSVIDDPRPNQELYDELGQKIIAGAKKQLAEQRKLKEHDIRDLTSEMRKYPWSWEEAKSMSNEFCHFNHMLLNKRLLYLKSLPKPIYRVGNFEYVNGNDGVVEFFRDDYKGRWKVAWLPDKTGDGGDIFNGLKIANNVGEDWDADNNRKIYFPKNDHLFSMGVDPIRNEKTEDPKASKAAMYVFMKYNPHLDTGVEREKWRSYRFIVEYIGRPEDPELFHEDMIKTCRYFGVSMFEEGNVETLRQHFKFRGYGAFLMHRGDFSDDTLPGVKKDGDYAYKAVRTDDVVTHTLIQKLQIYYNRDIDKIVFPTLLEASLKFRLLKGKKRDEVYGAGYTLIASERVTAAPEESNNTIPIELQISPMYDLSGTVSRQIDINEFSWN